MAAENDITSMHEAVDIFTATNLLDCPEFKSCLETIEHKYPQLSADDVVNMLINNNPERIAKLREREKRRKEKKKWKRKRRKLLEMPNKRSEK